MDLGFVSNFVHETELDPEKKWSVIDSLVVDVSKFADRHPGGSKILSAYIGKDASDTFRDGVLNRHSDAARTLVDMMAIARIVDEKH